MIHSTIRKKTIAFVFCAFVMFAFCRCQHNVGNKTASSDVAPRDSQTYLFVTKDLPYYRIPAIAMTRKGTLVAVADYRYGGTDIGWGTVELHCRTSADNGLTWSEAQEFTHGDKDMDTHPNYNAAYGDPCIVADRTSDRILVMSCSGNTPFYAGTRELHQGIARFYSTDEGKTWSDPDYLQDEIYGLFDNSERGPIRSMFIGSGKIHQSRFVRVGKYYRLYCSVLAKDKDGVNCNFVLWSDDFGGTWKVLGDINIPAIPNNADEPKVEEFPDGRVICSSRVTGGRYFNIFTYTDATKAEGSWGTCAASGESNQGVVAVGNSCNGEILIVPARRNSDKKKVHVALQSVPFGPGRTNVGIYYKVLDEPSDYDTPEHFAANWDGRYHSTTLPSAYSTYCLGHDGTIFFLFEETTFGKDYTLVFKPYTVGMLTDGKYQIIPKSKRSRK